MGRHDIACHETDRFRLFQTVTFPPFMAAARGFSQPKTCQTNGFQQKKVKKIGHSKNTAESRPYCLLHRISAGYGAFTETPPPGFAEEVFLHILHPTVPTTCRGQGHPMWEIRPVLCDLFVRTCRWIPAAHCPSEQSTPAHCGSSGSCRSPARTPFPASCYADGTERTERR